MVIVSAIVLGLSVLATLAKFLDWFMHSDPRTMVRTMRWILLLLLLVLIVLAGLSIANQNWSMAMLLGAATLGIPLFMKWRAVLGPFRAMWSALRPGPRPFDMEVWQDPPDDPQTVRRAAAILEAYVNRTSLVPLQDLRRGQDDGGGHDERLPDPMSRGEALAILGVEPGAEDAEIRAAHRRLLHRLHPDRGGSAWLAQRVYEAGDILLKPRVEERDEGR